MSLDPETLHHRAALYSYAADHLAAGPHRDVAMLGMMACAAASWRRLQDMPAEWGWARADDSRLPPEIAPRTPQAENE